MGKYANYSDYLPAGSYTMMDLAKAIVKAQRDAVNKKIDVMAENYKEGQVKLRRTTPELMATRLATWLETFFGADIPGKYLDVMADVRSRYKKARPRVPSPEIGAL